MLMADMEAKLGTARYLKDAFKELTRVREAQQESLKACEEDIEKMTKYRSDYESLRKRLATLPDKTSHDVMVPFGTLAFMPGNLIHTNEILVLLGDGWFAERSAKQACEIIMRRIQDCDDQLKSLDSSHRIHLSWLDEASKLTGMETGNEVEIIETMTEEEYVHSKGMHCKKKTSQSHEYINSSDKDLKQGATLLARLDELAAEELALEAVDEKDTTDEDNTEEEEDSSEEEATLHKVNPLRKRVSWADVNGSETLSFGQVQDARNERETVYISYSSSADPVMKEFQNGNVINSPADICRMFGHTSVHGILKKRNSESLVDTDECFKDIGFNEIPLERCSSASNGGEFCESDDSLANVRREGTNPEGSALMAFSGQVVLRESVDKTEVAKEETVVPSEHKRISKFKTNRMKS